MFRQCLIRWGSFNIHCKTIIPQNSIQKWRQRGGYWQAGRWLLAGSEVVVGRQVLLRLRGYISVCPTLQLSHSDVGGVGAWRCCKGVVPSHSRITYRPLEAQISNAPCPLMLPLRPPLLNSVSSGGPKAEIFDNGGGGVWQRHNSPGHGRQKPT